MPEDPGRALDAAAEGLLAQLQAESGAPLGGLGARFSTPASRVGLMIAGTAAVAVVVLLVLAVLGALLR